MTLHIFITINATDSWPWLKNGQQNSKNMYHLNIQNQNHGSQAFRLKGTFFEKDFVYKTHVNSKVNAYVYIYFWIKMFLFLFWARHFYLELDFPKQVHLEP